MGSNSKTPPAKTKIDARVDRLEDRVDSKLDRITDKLEQTNATLSVMATTLVTNTKSLEEHIKRSNLLEDSLEIHKKESETRLKAIEESHIVKEKYPAFWKLYKMIEEMNFELTALQDAMEKKGKGGRI